MARVIAVKKRKIHSESDRAHLQTWGVAVVAMAKVFVIFFLQMALNWPTWLMCG